jgi:aminoglycoside phosphotransferase (APT) family kinase protein
MIVQEEWHADIDITEDLVVRCIVESFSELVIQSICLLGEGWDNKVFLINDSIVFRFPRKKSTAILLEQENQVLQKLEVKQLLIPRPIYIGKPTSDYPYTFHGYHLIAGENAYCSQLTELERIASLPALANFIRQLHSIDADAALAMGAERQSLDRTEGNKIVDVLTERVMKIIDRQVVSIDMTCFKDEMTIAQTINLDNYPKCLVHGDLDVRHLIFKDKKLFGIIDWGMVGINNKAIDLSLIWGFYSAEQHQQFFDCYGYVESDVWQYARFLAIYSGLSLLVYGADIQDAGLVSEAKMSLRNISPGLLRSDKHA